MQDLPGVGEKTAAVISEALAGETPEYLQKLLAHAPEPGTHAGEALRVQLRGDLHGHSDWSDGGHTIRAMAEKARELGHEYFALTDHSPRLKVANGLSRERLLEQLDIVAELNEELAPFRILTGVEVDILEDGALDHDDDILERLDWVVASVHSKLRMDHDAMTAPHGEGDRAPAGRRARPLHRPPAHRPRASRVGVRPREDHRDACSSTTPRSR